jgi:precorrin-4 methylase
LAAGAIAQGLAPDTPAVAVASATRPDEVVVAGTVADIGTKLAAMPLPGPALVFIGRVFENVARMERSEIRDPHSAPLHSASKTRVNALVAGYDPSRQIGGTAGHRR